MALENAPDAATVASSTDAAEHLPRHRGHSNADGDHQQGASESAELNGSLSISSTESSTSPPSKSFGEEPRALLGSRRPLAALKAYTRESLAFYTDRSYNPRCVRDLRAELLSGMTVAIMQVPESVAFSFVCNVDPIVGLVRVNLPY